MSGPPRKPLQFRRAEGNLAKSKIRPESEDPQLPVGTPDRPAHLTGAARKCWEELVPILAGAKLLTLGDCKALEIGCAAYGDWIAARRVVTKEGMTYESSFVDDDGNERKIIRPRPEVAIASDAWKRFRAFLTEYGLTAASRGKVSPIHNSGNGEEKDFS